MFDLTAMSHRPLRSPGAVHAGVSLRPGRLAAAPNRRIAADCIANAPPGAETD